MYQYNDTGKQTIVMLLVENGADLNIVNNSNNTALIAALDGGNHWIVIWKNCKSFLKRTRGFLAFELAAEVLVRNGANINRALYWAAENGMG